MEETPGARSQEMFKLENQLCFALYEASRATIDIYRPLLEGLGITYPQYLVLLILWERGMCSLKEIGTLLHLDSGTLSPLLKRLEASGLILRRRRPADERIVDISLTENGQALQQRASSIPEKCYAELDLAFDDYLGLLTRLKQLSAQLHARTSRRVAS
ncbi:MAG TPA: MarR family transcriptional regulator [Ktedonobacteraceae bacterium]|jgi:DNA-binding MarR family transcriptional regulator